MIIKADDMTDSSSSSWQAFLQTLQDLDIQASVGTITRSIVVIPKNIASKQALRDSA